MKRIIKNRNVSHESIPVSKKVRQLHNPLSGLPSILTEAMTRDKWASASPGQSQNYCKVSTGCGNFPLNVPFSGKHHFNGSIVLGLSSSERKAPKFRSWDHFFITSQLSSPKWVFPCSILSLLHIFCRNQVPDCRRSIRDPANCGIIYYLHLHSLRNLGKLVPELEGGVTSVSKSFGMHYASGVIVLVVSSIWNRDTVTP